MKYEEFMEMVESQPELEFTELGGVIWEASRADEGTISATGAAIVARAVDAAGYKKAESQAIDRETLYKLIPQAIATYQKLSTNPEYGGDLVTAITDAVMEHISAQEAATEVEWRVPGELGIAFTRFESSARAVAAANGAPLQRRTVTAWQEVPADE